MFDAQCDVAALVYDRNQSPDEVPLNFVAELQRRGRRPVGLVQRSSRCRNGRDPGRE